MSHVRREPAGQRGLGTRVTEEKEGPLAFRRKREAEKTHLGEEGGGRCGHAPERTPLGPPPSGILSGGLRGDLHGSFISFPGVCPQGLVPTDWLAPSVITAGPDISRGASRLAWPRCFSGPGAETHLRSRSYR